MNDLEGKTVSIVALGPSAEAYYKMAEGYGNRFKLCDETWCINSNGNILACDKIFHMDDVRIQLQRAATNVKIRNMLEWMMNSPCPIYTSRTHPDFPGLLEYPLEEVIRACGTCYFNNTMAYAVGFAIYKKVGQMNIYGADFTWPNRHQAEQGRGCVEYWLGRAEQRGIKVFIPNISSLMDAYVPADKKLYGYDTLDVNVEFSENDVKVIMVEKSKIPSSHEIEERYDHNK
jgi:hypothetical protein